jgi:hypothetical protein
MKRFSAVILLVKRNIYISGPWTICLVSTVKQSGKVCAKCRIKFYKMGKYCDLYDNLGADASALQKVEQEEHDSSHEAEDTSTSNVAIEILNSSLQASGESPIKKYLQDVS